MSRASTSLVLRVYRDVDGRDKTGHITKRQAAGLTQADLAAKLGEYQSFVARLESGQRRLDVVEFLELAEVLGFDPTKAISALRKMS